MAFSARYLLFLQQEDREDRFLAILQPFDPVAEAVTSLYQATETYGTKPGDSLPSQRFEAQLKSGFQFAAAVDIPDLAGILPSAQGGTIRIQQEFGNLDSWRTGYYFDGRPIQLLHGGWSEETGDLAFDEYGELFDGEIEGQPEVGLDYVDLELRSAEQRLDFPVCDRFHRGLSWMLYGDGTDDYVDCGTNAAFDFTDLTWTAEAMLCPEAAPATTTPIFSKTNGTDRGWKLLFNPDRTVALQTFQTGPASQTSTSTDLFTVNRTALVSIQMFANGTCRIYFDGKLNVSLPGHIAPSSSSDNLYILRNNAGTRFLNAFVAELRLWNVQRTAAEISDCAQRTLTADERLLPELVGYWPCADGSGTTLDDVSATNANGTIAGAIFRRALEGAESLEGERMLEVWGPQESVTGHLVEANPPIWQLHSDKVNAVLFGREGGAPRAVNAPYTSRAAFLAATTVAPKVDVLVSAGGTFARAAVPTTKKMTFDVEGDASDGTYRTRGPDLIRYWITTRGPNPFDDATEIDDVSFDYAATAATQPHQLVYDGETTLREICNLVLRSGGWSLWKTRNTKLIRIHRFQGVAVEIGIRTDPPTLTEAHVVHGSLVPAKVRAPVGMVSVYCRKNPTLMASSDLLISLLDSSHDDLRRFLLQEWSTARAYNAPVRLRRKQARELIIDSTLATLAGGRAAAQREKALWGGNEQALSFLSSSTSLSLDVMDAVYFHYQDQDEDGALQSRLDTSATAAYIVIAVGVDLEQGAVRQTLYREDS